MVSGDFKALSAGRAARARLLADRYPPAREALAFLAQIASLQGAIDRDEPLASRADLVRLVLDQGPQPLRVEAGALTEAACREAMERYLKQQDTTSLRSFFARVLLQPHVHGRGAEGSGAERGHPPRCGHPPQAGYLRPHGDGTALWLVCSLCLGEWRHSRTLCPHCGEADEARLVYYSAPAPELAHLQLLVCESCRRYLHTVDQRAEPGSVADVDEVAGLPLDVWAHERGYRKIHPSLVGI